MSPVRVLAQSCCSPATTPSDAINHPAPPAGKLQIGIYAEHYALAGGRRGTEDFTYPGDRHSSAQIATLSGYFGVTNRFAVAGLVPFNRRTRSDVATTGERVARKSTGLGDVSLLGYANLLSRLSRREWTVGAGVKLATGMSRAEDGSGELPQELQPGTGANDGLFTSTYSQALGPFTASAGLTWRITGTLTKIEVISGSSEEVRRQYRFGNEVLYGTSVAWSPDAVWGFEFDVRGRHAEPDEGTRLNADGTTTGVRETLPSTGGERVWLAPTLRFVLPETKAAVSLGVLVPVYENLRGSQLGSQLGLRFSVEGQP
ncbi:MAG: hypothetical protein ABIS67_09935 [Candidatus Eisenbacteria bacterium]